MLENTKKRLLLYVDPRIMHCPLQNNNNLTLLLFYYYNTATGF